MGFGKAVIIFLIISAFALTAVGMAATMLKDKPTDSYYTDLNNTATQSTGMIEGIVGSGTTMMLPLIGIAGILVLGAAFMVLRK